MPGKRCPGTLAGISPRYFSSTDNYSLFVAMASDYNYTYFAWDVSRWDSMTEAIWGLHDICPSLRIGTMPLCGSVRICNISYIWILSMPGERCPGTLAGISPRYFSSTDNYSLFVAMASDYNYTYFAWDVSRWDSMTEAIWGLHDIYPSLRIGIMPLCGSVRICNISPFLMLVTSASW